jgi:predicted nucleotidyltransferase
MQEKITQWVEAVKAQQGKQLISVMLYGSAVRGEYSSKHSDLNLLVVLKEIELAQLSLLGALTRKHLGTYAPNLVFWTQAEIENAWDVFPLEFSDIQARHQVLFGQDLFAKKKLSLKNVRYQLEFELRSKLLRLRESWLGLEGDTGALERFLVKAGGSFDYLLSQASEHFFKRKAFAPELFSTLKLVKQKKKKLNRAELQQIYHELHETVERAVERINAA